MLNPNRYAKKHRGILADLTWYHGTSWNLYLKRWNLFEPSTRPLLEPWHGTCTWKFETFPNLTCTWNPLPEPSLGTLTWNLGTLELELSVSFTWNPYLESWNLVILYLEPLLGTSEPHGTLWDDCPRVPQGLVGLSTPKLSAACYISALTLPNSRCPSYKNWKVWAISSTSNLWGTSWPATNPHSRSWVLEASSFQRLSKAPKTLKTQTFRTRKLSFLGWKPQFFMAFGATGVYYKPQGFLYQKLRVNRLNILGRRFCSKGEEDKTKEKCQQADLIREIARSFTHLPWSQKVWERHHSKSQPPLFQCERLDLAMLRYPCLQLGLPAAACRLQAHAEGVRSVLWSWGWRSKKSQRYKDRVHMACTHADIS